MALPREGAVTPVAILDIGVDLFDGVDDSEGVRYRVQVEFSDGSIIERKGNLAPHLTSQQIAALRSFMESLRAQAEAEMLPGT